MIRANHDAISNFGRVEVPLTGSVKRGHLLRPRLVNRNGSPRPAVFRNQLDTNNGQLGFVLVAFFADAERSAAVRRFALAFACLESAAEDTIWCFSPFSFFVIARERLGLTAFPGCFPRSRSRSACSRTSSETVPLLGGGSFTPARRAFESPMAIACPVERAPCFPRGCARSPRARTRRPASTGISPLVCLFALARASFYPAW